MTEGKSSIEFIEATGERDWDELVKCDLSVIQRATGEWRCSKGFETGWKNFAEKLMLIVTEASEAMDALVELESLRLKLKRPSLGELPDVAQKYIHYLDNYIEEWVDAMVRILDLADACRLNLRATREKPYPPMRHRDPCDHDDLSVSGRAQLVIFVHWMSDAMEKFRDVRLMRPSAGDPLVPGPDDMGSVYAIEEALSDALGAAIVAIRDVGEEWEPHYAAKMKKNEGRPEKHGRER